MFYKHQSSFYLEYSVRVGFVFHSYMIQEKSTIKFLDEVSINLSFSPIRYQLFPFLLFLQWLAIALARVFFLV